VPTLFDDLTWRGLVHQVTDVALAARLDAEPITAYIGFDPTADSLHVGSLQQICTLRRLQQAGHRPIALVGGGTGMIGDPSFKSDERVLLTPDVLATNREGIRAQLARFLDFSTPGGADTGALLADNVEWLGEVGLLEFLRDVGKHFSVNDMIRKDSVRARLEGRDQGLSFTEFSYMLLQSWDFVALHDRFGCLLQLGGSDQWGNITEGVDLLRRLRSVHGYGLTSPLVTKADGTKFGKTETGTVWLDAARTSPYQFFQFWFGTVDAEVASFLRRFTFLDHETIEALDAATTSHPERREGQRVLAREVTAMVHGADEAGRAERAAGVLFTADIAGLDPNLADHGGAGLGPRGRTVPGGHPGLHGPARIQDQSPDRPRRRRRGGQQPPSVGRAGSDARRRPARPLRGAPPRPAAPARPARRQLIRRRRRTAAGPGFPRGGDLAAGERSHRIPGRQDDGCLAEGGAQMLGQGVGARRDLEEILVEP
jgi:tyrosyl-tRNA synthetase